jgi:hypothetical protein
MKYLSTAVNTSWPPHTVTSSKDSWIGSYFIFLTTRENSAVQRRYLGSENEYKYDYFLILKKVVM